MITILRILILLTVSTLPLYIIRVEIFNLPTTYLEILIVITFGVFLRTRIGQIGFKPAKVFSKTKFDIPIILLLISAALALIPTDDLRGGFGIYKAFFLEPALLYYMITTTFKGKQSQVQLVCALSIAGLWLSAFALLQAFAGSSPFAPHELSQGRLAAVYNSANALALFVGPVFCFLLPFCFLGKGFIRGTILYFFLVSVLFILGLIIIETNSKGSLIAVFAVLILLPVFYLKKNFDQAKLFYLPLLTLLISLMIPIASPFLIDLTPATQATEFKGGDTTQIRLYLWEGTAGILTDRPFTGAGLDGFKELFSRNYSIPQYREPLQYPHNFFLTVLSELGILGLGAFLFLFWRLFSVFKNSNVVNIGLSLTFIYFFVHGLVDVPYFKNDLASQFFIFLAMLEVGLGSEST